MANPPSSVFTGLAGIFIHIYVQVNTEHKDVAPIITNPETKIITRVSFLLKNQIMTGSQSGKIQVINNFGETGWMLPQEYENKTLKMKE